MPYQPFLDGDFFRVGGRWTKITDEKWSKAERLIAASETRQRVAIIYDVGIPKLYLKLPTGSG